LRGADLVTRSTLLLLIGAAVAAAGGQLLFKIGAQNRTHAMDFVNVPIALGLLVYGTGAVLWILALSKEKLIVAYAFAALTFALVYVGGIWLLGESLSARGAMGLALVLGGLYLLAT
jgi:multidrug transporter EmrE-like cation transporter